MESIAAIIGDAVPPATALFLIATSFFTSVISAAIGLGGGMVLMAVMTQFIPVAVLIPVHGAVQLASNTARASVQRKHVVWSMLGWFVVGSIVGALVGGQMVLDFPDRWLKLVLALVIFGSVWDLIPYWLLAGRSGPFTFGVISSFMSMFVGATGGLIAALFSRLKDRKQTVGSQAAAAASQHLIKIIVFGALGFAYGPYLPLILAMIVTGFFGTLVGSKLLDRLPEKLFRILFKSLLTLLALNLLRLVIWQ